MHNADKANGWPPRTFEGKISFSFSPLFLFLKIPITPYVVSPSHPPNFIYTLVFSFTVFFFKKAWLWCGHKRDQSPCARSDVTSGMVEALNLWLFCISHLFSVWTLGWIGRQAGRHKDISLNLLSMQVIQERPLTKLYIIISHEHINCASVFLKLFI